MTTRADSFDASRTDSFVHSLVDERNLSALIPLPVGKIIVLYMTYGGQAHALHGEGYVNGPFEDPEQPIYREDYPTGIAKWDADFAKYSDLSSRWNSAEAEMRSGILHAQVWIPYIGGWFSWPLRPWVREGDISSWTVMQRGINAENELGYLQELTLQLVDPADLIYSITLVHGGSVVSAYPQDAHHPWLWHHPWVDWARLTFTRMVESPIPGYGLFGIQAYGMPISTHSLRESHRWLALGNELIERGSWT